METALFVSSSYSLVLLEVYSDRNARGKWRHVAKTCCSII